jgi:hypothetical protein
MEDYDYIINDYLKYITSITKEETDHMHNNLCWHNPRNEGLNLKHFKIVNNQLYKSNNDNFEGWETRIEGFKYMLLRTLQKYKITDCEIFIYDDDGINESNIEKCVYNEKLLPIIVTTSVLCKYNMILCPDFTFSFFPEACVENNEKMCKRVVDIQEKTDFKNKINKIVWRGSGNTLYRSQYLNNDENYDIMSVLTHTRYRGDIGSSYTSTNGLTREERSKYKYQLYLNGHEGNDRNGAYSSSYKWALMSKSVVFYSAPAMYREFWTHPYIFKENKHFIYAFNTNELHQKYMFLKNNENISEQIALNSFEFFKKYLLDYDIILYYMNKLLNEYAKRITYKVELNATDRLITNIERNDFIDVLNIQ